MALVTVGLAALAFLGGPAAAQVYTNTSEHFHLTIPDNWTASEDAGAVSFMEGMYSTWNTNVAVGADPSAKNTTGYTLAQVTTQCNAATSMMSGTYVTSPHSITGAGGRPGGECVYDVTLGTTMRFRTTIFASDVYDRIYIIQSSDNSTHYVNLTSTWDTMVSSFVVDGEGTQTGNNNNNNNNTNNTGTNNTGNNNAGTGGGLGGLTLYIIIGVVAAVAVGAFVMMRGKGKKGASQPPAGETAPAPPQPPK